MQATKHKEILARIFHQGRAPYKLDWVLEAAKVSVHAVLRGIGKRPGEVCGLAVDVAHVCDQPVRFKVKDKPVSLRRRLCVPVRRCADGVEVDGYSPRSQLPASPVHLLRGRLPQGGEHALLSQRFR
jgi:hypothetical protein